MYGGGWSSGAIPIEANVAELPDAGALKPFPFYPRREHALLWIIRTIGAIFSTPASGGSGSSSPLR